MRQVHVLTGTCGDSSGLMEARSRLAGMDTGNWLSRGSSRGVSTGAPGGKLGSWELARELDGRLR